jgi:hypothetical protein
LGVNKKSTNLAVLSELGRCPLYFSVVLSMLRYWFRIDKITPYNWLSGQQMLSGTQIISTSHGMTGRNFFDFSSILSTFWILDLCLICCTTNHRYLWTGHYVAPLFFFFFFFFFLTSTFFHINNILQLSMYHCMTYIQ